MRRLLACLVALLTAHFSYGQLEHANWYFGQNCAVSFVNGEPENLPNGAMNTLEGCASISDYAGNLLFYTNGVQVFANNHQVMQNGDSLLGHTSSAQAALINRVPGTINRYYIFTTDAFENGGANGLRYSVVDMDLDGGLGAVIEKNVELISPIDEKLTGTPDPTGQGYWILSHQQPSSFVAFHVTGAGISPPVITNTGFINPSPNPYGGYITVSQNGEKVALCYYSSKISLGEFDKNNGVLNNHLLINTGALYIYAASFSPSGEILYCTHQLTPSRLIQFDVSIYDSIYIESSIINLPNVKVAGLQLAPDGKIYVAQYNKNFLGVINSPDSLGFACNYVDTGIVLNSISRFGLPNLIRPADYPQPQAVVHPLVTKICPDSCIGFANGSANGAWYEWFFAGATPSYSTDENPTGICYDSSGNYTVTLVAHHGPNSDTAVMNGLVQVYAAPQPFIVSSGDTLWVSGIAGTASHQWFLDGSPLPAATLPFYLPQQPGLYSVAVTNAQGCSGAAQWLHTTVRNATALGPTLHLDALQRRLVARPPCSNWTLAVYNAMGQVVLSVEGAGGELFTAELSNLPTGFYLACLHGDVHRLVQPFVLTGGE